MFFDFAHWLIFLLSTIVLLNEEDFFAHVCSALIGAVMITQGAGAPWFFVGVLLAASAAIARLIHFLFGEVGQRLNTPILIGLILTLIGVLV